MEAPGIYELDFLNELIEEVTGIDKLLKAVASGKVQTDRILYNRVPKCASTTLRYIFGDLATANNFNLEVSSNFAQEAVNETGEVRAFQLLWGRWVEHIQSIIAAMLLHVE